MSTPLLSTLVQFENDFRQYNGETVDRVMELVGPDSIPWYSLSQELLYVLWIGSQGSLTVGCFLCAGHAYLLRDVYHQVYCRRWKHAIRIRVLLSRILLKNVSKITEEPTLSRLLVHDMGIVEEYHGQYQFSGWVWMFRFVVLLVASSSLSLVVGITSGTLFVGVPLLFSLLHLVRVHNRDEKGEDQLFVEEMKYTEQIGVCRRRVVGESRRGWWWWWTLMLCIQVLVYGIATMVYVVMDMENLVEDPFVVLWVMSRLLFLMYDGANGMFQTVRYYQSIHRVHAFLGRPRSNTNVVFVDDPNDAGDTWLGPGDTLRETIVKGRLYDPEWYQTAISSMDLLQWPQNTLISSLTMKERVRVGQARTLYQSSFLEEDHDPPVPLGNRFRDMLRYSISMGAWMSHIFVLLYLNDTQWSVGTRILWPQCVGFCCRGTVDVLDLMKEIDVLDERHNGEREKLIVSDTVPTHGDRVGAVLLQKDLLLSSKMFQILNNGNREDLWGTYGEERIRVREEETRSDLFQTWVLTCLTTMGVSLLMKVVSRNRLVLLLPFFLVGRQNQITVRMMWPLW